MILNFTHLGRAGTVAVDVSARAKPDVFGGDEHNQGFPACFATVSYDGDGYDAMMGWVQLVRSTDVDTPGFGIDPYVLFPDIDSPYGFYGYKPTLFDFPGRTHRNDMDWLAHAFLATTPIEHRGRHVRPLAAFAWGFTIRDTRVEVSQTTPLPLEAWAEHIPYLQTVYSGWHFDVP